MLLQILQKSYPQLSEVTDCLLEIYVRLTGNRHQSENNISEDKHVTEDAVQLSPETKRPSLEGRELSLRYCKTQLS